MIRWQKWQLTPSKSLNGSSIRPESEQPSTLPAGGSDRPPSQPWGT